DDEVASVVSDGDCRWKARADLVRRDHLRVFVERDRGDVEVRRIGDHEAVAVRGEAKGRRWDLADRDAVTDRRAVAVEKLSVHRLRRIVYRPRDEKSFAVPRDLRTVAKVSRRGERDRIAQKTAVAVEHRHAKRAAVAARVGHRESR